MGKLLLSTNIFDEDYFYAFLDVVCESVCLPVGHMVSHAKTAEPIEMPFGEHTTFLGTEVAMH